MSLDYRLTSKSRRGEKLDLEKLQSLVSSQFEIVDYQCGSDGELIFFSLKRRGENEVIDLGLLQEGGYVINIYDYDRVIYQRILRNLATTAKLLGFSILDVQTREIIENPDPKTVVTPQRLEILEVQAHTLNNLPDILTEAEKGRKN